MRFESIKTKGLGPFRDEVTIDLASIDGKIVAITGANGAGKSTLLELLAGSLYRQCPTRGPLASLATARDAFVEVEVVNGQRYRVRQTVDCISGKGETVIVDANNRPVVASGKVRDADNYVAKHLVPPEVLYASTFAAQGSGGFLDLRPADRKSVLLRILGIEHLEALAAQAREKARDAKGNVATMDARIADAKARASDPVKTAAELEELQAKRQDIEVTLSNARAQLEELTAQEEIAREAGRKAIEQAKARRELEERLGAARTRLADLDKRIGNNQGLIAQADEIRAAQKRAADLDAKIAEVVGQIGDAKAAEASAVRDRDTARNALADISNRLQRARERYSRAKGRLAQKPEIDQAIAALDGWKSQVQAAEKDFESCETSVQSLGEATLDVSARRIAGLRTGLFEVDQSDDLVECHTTARRTVDTDDKLAESAETAPTQLDAARKRMTTARETLATKRRWLQQTEMLAARAGEIEAAEAEMNEARAEVEALTAQEPEARATYDAATEVASTKVATLSKLIENRRSLEGERAAIDPLLKLADRLTQAEARIAELEPQRVTLEVDITSLEEGLELAPVPQPPSPMPDVAGAKRRIEGIDRELRSVEAAIAVKTAQLSDAHASATKLAALEDERKRADDELADWTRLAADLGKDGLQSLEIDAAGPELTALVNDLLHTCVGARWTVSVEASKLSSDGKKMLEGCEVRIIDCERGREGAAETLSGGERVLVGEAVSLALSMLACRRSGVQGPTLVRDESGAALDPANARAYVAMLRRAADVVGASHVLFVSHSQDVQEMADARIEVRDGTVRVAA